MSQPQWYTCVFAKSRRGQGSSPPRKARADAKMCFRMSNPPKIVEFFSGARRARWASHQLSAAAPPTFAKFRARWGAPNFSINFRESLIRA